MEIATVYKQNRVGPWPLIEPHIVPTALDETAFDLPQNNWPTFEVKLPLGTTPTEKHNAFHVVWADRTVGASLVTQLNAYGCLLKGKIDDVPDDSQEQIAVAGHCSLILSGFALTAFPFIGKTDATPADGEAITKWWPLPMCSVSANTSLFSGSINIASVFGNISGVDADLTTNDLVAGWALFYDNNNSGEVVSGEMSMSIHRNTILDTVETA